MNEVTKIISDFLEKNKGVEEQSPFLSLWESWYLGFDKRFHRYRTYSGSKYINQEKKSFGIGKKICEDWANLLLNERCDIIVPKQAKDALNSIFDRNSFWEKASGLLEKSFALGLGAFVEEVTGLLVNEDGEMVKATGKTKIKYINATKIYPITFEDGKITECAFVGDNTNFCNIEIHKKDASGNYEIISIRARKNRSSQTKITLDYDINKDVKTFKTNSNIAWFQFMRPNIENNLDVNSPLPISIFANAIDSMKALDEKYDGFDKEFSLGKKRIFVHTKATKFDVINGEEVKMFDNNDAVFYSLPYSDDLGKENKLLTIDTSELRAESYINAINQELNIISSKVGLGKSHYSFDSGGGRPLQTATMVMSVNSELFRNVKKHEIVIEQTLKDLMDALVYITNTFTDEPLGELSNKEVTIKFDDSIIEDKETEIARDRADVALGVLSKVEYRQKWYGEDEKTAEANIRKYSFDKVIADYTPALNQGTITPEDFVKKVYNFKESTVEFDNIVTYIKEFLASNRQPDLSDFYSPME